MEKPFNELIETTRNHFNTGCTKDVEFRKKQLKSFLCMMEENTDNFVESIERDLRKHKTESILCEIELVKNETRKALYKIDEWVKPVRPKTSLMNILDTLKIRNDPYGVVLILGPWNYPVLLLLKPFVGAIAAGNCVILKPSELAPATAMLISNIIPKYMDNDCYKVCVGGIPETTDLLKEKFDYILHTGSPMVGRIVREAANKYLTPVTLELGGKSPVYVDDSANMEIAARRIIWGKCINAGQACVSPDYVLCTKEVEPIFIEACKQAIKEFYGDNIKQNKDYGRIVTDRQFHRLKMYLLSGKIALGGDYNDYERYIEPTILIDVKETDLVMIDEIFGPILPIMNISSVDEAISFVNAREKPLALYIFSSLKADIQRIINETSSGGVCVNDVISHFICDSAPFGGVGQSGMGCVNAKYTFDTFTHKKTCLYKKLDTFGETLTAIRYAPYNDNKMNIMMKLLRPRRFISLKWLPMFFLFLLGVVITVSFYEYSKSKNR